MNRRRERSPIVKQFIWRFGCLHLPPGDAARFARAIDSDADDT
jgi:hypothetical protein